MPKATGSKSNNSIFHSWGCPSPSQANGTFAITGANIIPGWGGGWSAITIGSIFYDRSWLPKEAFGLDISISVMLGRSYVTSSKVETCCSDDASE